jgi:hypothetical protein
MERLWKRKDVTGVMSVLALGSLGCPCDLCLKFVLEHKM